MNEDSKKILIAVFLGWLGGYRFYKKQYLLGLLYFFTLGLFGIGWLYDILLALNVIKSNKKRQINNSDNIMPNTITEFYTNVVGVTYPCEQGPFETRQEALENLFINSWRKIDTLILEYYNFDERPAYKVINKRNYADIGNLKAELSKELYKNYKNNEIIISEFNVTGGENLKYGCNIKLQIIE